MNIKDVYFSNQLTLQCPSETI